MADGNQSEPAAGDFPCPPYISPVLFDLHGGSVVQIFITALAIPMSVAATLVNLLVIISIFRTPSLTSLSNFLLVSLACSDFCVGLVTFPAFIVSRVAKITRDAELYCKAQQISWVSGYCLCTASLLTLSAITLDRYVAIHYHLRYQDIVTVRRVRAVLVAIVTVSSAYGVLFSFGRADIVTNIYNAFAFSSLSFIIFASCSIYRVVRRHQRQIVSQLQVQVEAAEDGTLNLPSFKRSFMNMLIICWTVLLCYLPFTIITVVVSATMRTPPSTILALEWSLLLVNVNSTMNPLLYCWRYRPIREALLKLVRDLCGKTATQQ